MTTTYDVTKAIRKGQQLYICEDVTTGDGCRRVWTKPMRDYERIDTRTEPVHYNVPEWIRDRNLLSHGCCVDCVDTMRYYRWLRLHGEAKKA